MRQFRPIASWVPGIGGSLSFGIVPDRLRPVYDDRVSVGVMLFVNLRPAEMRGGMAHHGHVASRSSLAPTASPTLARRSGGAW